MKNFGRKDRQYRAILVIILLLILLDHAHASDIQVSYLYNLSSFTGTVPYDWVRVIADQNQNEVYVISGDSIKIFNDSGMEVYSFATYDMGLGGIYDLAVDDNGNILALAYKESKYSINICNFRGEPKGKIEVKGLLEEFSSFTPNRMVYQNGKIYLASLNSLQVVVVDSQGNFLKGYDLAPAVGAGSDEERADNDILGFAVTSLGNMLFTVPSTGKAYVLTPDNQVKGFGKRGSGPGKFGIPAGIVEDSSGNYLVADTLRCVVMIFDKDFRFIKEFGFRGLKPGNLIGPRELVLDKDDRLYVTQLRRRGVSVFKLAETN